MRFTIFHCHNPACGHRVWVPMHRLGTSGKCPECGTVLTIPGDLPADQFFDGPDVLQDTEQVSAASVGIAQDMREFA
jgi:hypothetical protein